MSVKSKRHCISRQGLSEIFKTQLVISGENEIVKGNVKRVKADWPAARTCTEKREKKFEFSYMAKQFWQLKAL